MVIRDVFGLNSTGCEAEATQGVFSRIISVLITQLARLWCGLQGHSMMLHFEPNKLSLQCGLCGYASDGWEVGRPMTARRQVNNPQARPERRRTLRPLPSSARLAS